MGKVSTMKTHKSKHWAWIGSVLVGLIVLTLQPGTADAQDRKETYLDTRFTIAALVGYQWGGSVDFSDGYAEIDSGPTIGGELGLKVAQNTWIILNYHHQFTSGTTTTWNGTTQDSETVDLGVGYLQIGGQIEFPVSAHLVPLLGLTLGASYFSRTGDVDNTDWFFAFVFYGGLKIPVVKNFGFLTQLKLLTTVIANNSHTICVSYRGCAITLDAGAMVQGEVTGGIYVAF
jgi:hypothetical protein